jgi:hypothetical protein
MVTRTDFTRVSARKIHFLGIKIKTRLEFSGKMILKMNLVVESGFGGWSVRQMWGGWKRAWFEEMLGEGGEKGLTKRLSRAWIF